MILIGIENGIFPLPKENPLGAYNWEKNEMSLTEFLPERDEEFYTPKEVTTRNKISYFGIRTMFEEITPRDTSDLESEESAEESRNQNAYQVTNLFSSIKSRE